MRWIAEVNQRVGSSLSWGSHAGYRGLGFHVVLTGSAECSRPLAVMPPAIDPWLVISFAGMSPTSLAGTFGSAIQRTILPMLLQFGGGLTIYGACVQAHKAFKKHKAEILLYVDRMDLVSCTLSSGIQKLVLSNCR